ncbi:hypothetical protein ABZP36_004311, partial [Zizania latifolia]
NNDNDDDPPRDHDVEQIGAVDTSKYLSIVAQHVLSAQMEKAEQNQRHNLFQSRFVVKER